MKHKRFVSTHCSSIGFSKLVPAIAGLVGAGLLVPDRAAAAAIVLSASQNPSVESLFTLSFPAQGSTSSASCPSPRSGRSSSPTTSPSPKSTSIATTIRAT